MTKGDGAICALGAVVLVFFIHLGFKNDSPESLNIIYNNKKEFMIRLGLDQNKTSCYKQPQWSSEHCNTVTDKGFPAQFYCDSDHCEFMK